jgi:hypothetical protein
MVREVDLHFCAGLLTWKSIDWKPGEERIEPWITLRNAIKGSNMSYRRLNFIIKETESAVLNDRYQAKPMS